MYRELVGSRCCMLRGWRLLQISGCTQPPLLQAEHDALFLPTKHNLCPDPPNLCPDPPNLCDKSSPRSFFIQKRLQLSDTFPTFHHTCASPLRLARPCHPGRPAHPPSTRPHCRAPHCRAPPASATPSHVYYVLHGSPATQYALQSPQDDEQSPAQAPKSLPRTHPIFAQTPQSLPTLSPLNV